MQPTTNCWLFIPFFSTDNHRKTKKQMVLDHFSFFLFYNHYHLLLTQMNGTLMVLSSEHLSDITDTYRQYSVVNYLVLFPNATMFWKRRDNSCNISFTTRTMEDGHVFLLMGSKLNINTGPESKVVILRGNSFSSGQLNKLNWQTETKNTKEWKKERESEIVLGWG